MTGRLLRTLLASAALAVAASGCLIPSLPTPPPEPEAMSFALDETAGLVTFHSDAQPGWGDAMVFVWDETTRRGTITSANPDGSVDDTDAFPAAAGDHVIVEFRLPEQSSAICLVVRDGAVTSADLCP